MNSITKKIAGIITALVLVSAVVISISYNIYGIYAKQADGASTRVIAKTFALPVAYVGKRSVSYTRFLETRDAVERFINSEAGQEVGASMPSRNELSKNIMEQLLRQKMVEEFAAKQNVTVTKEDIDLIFEQIVTEAAAQDTNDIGKYLQDNYGWNEQNFRDYVLRPAVLEQKTAMALAGGSFETGDPYALEDALINRRQASDVVIYLNFEE
jgi:hypothetical protein